MANLVDQLNHEWSTLVATSDSAVATWAADVAELSSCIRLGDVHIAIRHSPDRALAFLISRFQAGDELAGRTVLQSMLGKLVRMARTGIASTTSDALDDLVTQMWCQIAIYPLANRPNRIAANLAWDAFKWARKEWLAASHINQATAKATDLAAFLDRIEMGSPPPEPTAERVIDAALAMGIITDTTHAVLKAVYGPECLTGELAARRWGCTPAAIRTRCKDAVRNRMVPHAFTLMVA